MEENIYRLFIALCLLIIAQKEIGAGDGTGGPNSQSRRPVSL